MKHDAHLNQLIDQWAADRPARRLEADRVKRQSEDFQLHRPKPTRTAPQIPLTNNRTRQTELFDAGRNDLPGQKHLFDDITQEPIQ